MQAILLENRLKYNHKIIIICEQMEKFMNALHPT